MKQRVLALIVCALFQTVVLGAVDLFAPRHSSVIVSLKGSDDPARIVAALNALPDPPRHIKVTTLGEGQSWMDIPSLFIGLTLWSAIIVALYHLSGNIVNRCLVLKKSRHVP